MYRMMNLRWWACCAVAFTACVKPGELDNKEEFERLLYGDGGRPDGGVAMDGGGARAGNGGSSGSGMGNSGTGASAMGCPEACDLIKNRCATAGCHSATSPQAMLDLASPNIAMRLANKSGTTTGCTTKKLFVANKPEESMIYGKLLNPPACGTQRMPVGLPLKEDEIACMMRWISNPVCGNEPSAGAGGAKAGAGGARAGAGAGGMGGTRAGAGGTMEPPSGSTIWIEAEDASMVTPPLEVADDGDASGGKFVRVPMQDPDIRMTPPEDTSGIATYTFEVTDADTYRFWGRVRLPDAEGNSFWVKIDDGDWLAWNNIEEAMTASEIPFAEFAWDDFHDSGNAGMVIQEQLDEGEHTLQIGWREDHAEIDKILVTNDTNLTPMGEGE